MREVTTLFLKIAVIYYRTTGSCSMYIFSAPYGEFLIKIGIPNCLMKYLRFIDMYGAAIPFYFALFRLLIFYGTLIKTQRCRNYL